MLPRSAKLCCSCWRSILPGHVNWSINPHAKGPQHRVGIHICTDDRSDPLSSSENIGSIYIILDLAQLCTFVCIFFVSPLAFHGLSRNWGRVWLYLVLRLRWWPRCIFVNATSIGLGRTPMNSHVSCTLIHRASQKKMSSHPSVKELSTTSWNLHTARLDSHKYWHILAWLWSGKTKGASTGQYFTDVADEGAEY